MKYRLSLLMLLSAILLGGLLPASAADEVKKDAPPTMYPVAVFAFQERGSGVKDYGTKIADIVSAMLGMDEQILLVDRQVINNTLNEQHLNLSGAVKPEEATQVGQLTGAKVLVTGSVFEAGKSLYITAKIIGTETTRVISESVKGATTDDLATMSEKLAQQVGARIVKDAGTLVAPPATTKDVIAELNKAMDKAERPAVTINISERHIGQPTIDPAAATEMALICKGTGFNVLDNAAGARPVPLQITGEGFSELATRIGDLVSVRARVEVKVVDPVTNKVLAIDRQTVIVVDVSEQIAGKSALQKATAEIAERLLPKLVTKPSEQK